MPFENYINLHHKYPDNYRGIRDETVLAKLDEDMEYDSKTGEIKMPRGKIIDGSFMYNGKITTKTDKMHKTPQ